MTYASKFLKLLGIANILVLATASSSVADETTPGRPFTGWDTRAALKGGYSSFNTRYPKGSGPFDVRFKHVEVLTLNGEVNTTYSNGFYGELKGILGHVSDGQSRYEAYNPSNFNALTARGEGSLNGVHTLDVSGAIGYNIMPFIDREMSHVLLRPLLGYAFARQNLNLRDMNISVNTSNPFGTDAGYVGKWYGPWVGLGLGLTLSEKHVLGFRLTYDFLFNHKATMATVPFNSNRTWGYGLSAQYAYQLTDLIQVTAGIDWARFNTESIKTQTLTGVSGTMEQAVWDRWNATLGIVYKF